jgi:hypothetical protein
MEGLLMRNEEIIYIYKWTSEINKYVTWEFCGESSQCPLRYAMSSQNEPCGSATGRRDVIAVPRISKITET